MRSDYDNSNRLTSIAKKVSDTDIDGIFEATDRAATTSQALNIDQGSNKLLGFNQSVLTQATVANGTRRTVSNVISAVNYQLDAYGNLVSDGLRAFDYNAENRLGQVNITKDGEAAKITYLHNAAGQRIFKSEPQTAQALPNETVLGTTFTDWLKKNFQWLYATAQTNATLGTSYSYGDGQLPSWAMTGEYGNGGATSAGRTEYIWLPTDDGSAIPIGMFRSNRFYAIHSDHLGTPRLMTDDTAKPVWQWAYSAFGDNKPTGVLKVTTNPNSAITNQPVLLQATGVGTTLNLRFPGQYADSETGLFYNYFRTYQPNQGRYTQNDPIGLAGGWNRYGYVGGSPLSFVDPMGLDAWGREMWTPARAWTDMTGQSTTYYDPMTRDLLIIPTRNDVTGSSLPGAAGPYSGEFTYCQYPNSNEFGTAKWRTTDSRYRWVHGGGSGLPDPLSARQGWRSTQGCTRAQNEDVEQLCRKSEQWQSKNPNQTIPYSRW